ncbi:papain like cysteine protease AvrRpt2 [Herbihabitans rhizosphaerae]|uniref:Papain like cysteine protease AvrRpt2 n=1 Tax=Herbihabitans rhizosphaerae TaxID=1872711 RepID=A0A4Q7KV35_9PSEU|nr:papain-like cysteine protease family protein [Herbihabitans rhizosphaerae]RZS40869.1 papain like cysteine protease AvrRpt2 [Herbihabitans rhizosphaerae]
MNTLRSRALLASAAALSGLLLSQVPAAAEPAASPAGSLDFDMQVQQKSNWCWAAAGTSIAVYHGTSVSQTRFCQLAHDESGSGCYNDQGNLGEVRWAFDQLGYSAPGNYLSNYLNFGSIQGQIDRDQPIETRILWSSGGGHMHAIYGYNLDSGGRQWVDWADPWGSNPRYNRSTYRNYVDNSEFSWTHTLTGIAR